MQLPLFFFSPTDDDFDQFDKPGAERSWRRRAGDDEWDRWVEYFHVWLLYYIAVFRCSGILYSNIYSSALSDTNEDVGCYACVSRCQTVPNVYLS